jgi:lipid-binding SYLF domain-containing protein
MFKVGFVIAAAISFAGIGSGCGARQQPTQSQQLTLQQNADAALDSMVDRDPGLRTVLPAAPAYVVFPDVGQAGAIVGGAYGHGVLYEHDQPVGEVTLSQGSVGFQLGAQTFSELLVLNDPDQIAALKSGQFGLGADATVVALKPGAAAGARFRNGQVVFIMPRGGLMAGITVNGQQIQYQPFAG